MLSKALLIFYILMASQYTSGLLGKQMRTFLEENRLAQHVIGFIMMVAIMKVLNLNSYLSIIAYALFVFSTKLDIQWNLIFILLLFLGYLYESNMEERESDIMLDATLTKNFITDFINNDTLNKKYIIGGISIAALIGVALYMKKKNVQYGGGFNMMTFLLY